MKRHIVEDADGNRHVIEAPDDWTPEQVAAEAQSVIPKKTSTAADGATLKVGPFDTGIGLPKQAAEFLAGAGRRFMDIGTLGNRPTRDARADAALDKSGWATLGGAGADISTLIGGGAAIRGAAALPGFAAKAPGVANAVRVAGQNMIAPTSVKNAAAVAGLYGAGTQEGGITDRLLTGAVTGAAGAAGQAIPSLIGNAIKPKLAGDVADLQNLGIRMTPGQMAGGAWNAAEQKAMSLPFVGDAIKGARMRSVEDFNRAIANEVLKPLGKKATQPAGRSLVQETQGVVKQAYDDVLPKITTTFNDALDQAIDAGKNLAATAGQDARFEAVLKQHFYGKFTNPAGFITGKTFKEIDSGLAESIRGAWGKGDAELAKAVQGVRTALRTTAQGAPEDLAKLKNADEAFAKLVRMENAAGMRGAKDGVFSPANFGNATERGASRSAKAAGKELMGPLADAAERRLSSAFPNSGTADRLLMNAAAAGAAGTAVGVYDVDPRYLLLAGAGAGMYTRPAQAMMRGLLARPQNLLPLDDVASGARALAPRGGLLAPSLLPVYASQE